MEIKLLGPQRIHRLVAGYSPLAQDSTVRRPSKRTVIIVAAVAFFMGIAGLVFSWLVGSALTAPAPSAVALPTGFEGTGVQFRSASGATLKGNLLRGSPGRGVVILMHGVRGHRGMMALRAELLHRHGYSVLLFDFQAHGESGGTQITSGYRESMDAASAVEFARENLPNERIGILGVSLGGAAAVLADPPLKIDGIVLEMVYSDIERAVKNRMSIALGDWARPLSMLLTAQLKARIGVGADWFSPERAIGKMTGPKLIIAGGKDRHTTRADSEALFAAADGDKEFWVIENGAHEDLYGVARGDYEKRVLEFLARTLRKN